jgi:rhodanese-related sulfurtransferase
VSGSPDPEIPEVSVTDAWAALERDGAAQLIDVRTKAEWSYVGVPDISSLGRQVLLVEWQSFPSNAIDPQFVERLSKAVTDAGGGQKTELFFLCRSGVRSLAAAQAMASAGYLRCRNVGRGFEGTLDPARHRGQLSGWKAAGLSWVQS